MIGVNFQVKSNQTKLTHELDNAVEQGATNTAPTSVLKRPPMASNADRKTSVKSAVSTKNPPGN